jgi:transposase
MQLKTILNRVQKFKSFVYGKVRWRDEARTQLEVEVIERANGRPLCSGCGRSAPGYDRLPRRSFEFVPLWGIQVFLLYAPRRVAWRCCGVRVEAMPWASGKRHPSEAYAWFLARWARRLSWLEVARIFHTSWDSVFRSVERAVEWGRAHQALIGVQAIGIDEIAWKKGHRYVTLVYRIDTHHKRLLWVGRHRKMKTLLGFFRWFGTERSQRPVFVCSDMWQPYLKAIGKKAGQAVHVLDRFRIMGYFSKAIDEVRAGEVKQLKANGEEPVLNKSRWLGLKRPENLTEKQVPKLKELLKHNLRCVRAYLLKEAFQRLWTYVSPYWAGRFLDQWCDQTMRSQIGPMKKVARTLRRHRPLILNWFRAKGQLSSGVVEGFNTKAKLTTGKAFGFRTYHGAEIALYHALGDLPEPNFTHRFC